MMAKAKKVAKSRRSNAGNGILSGVWQFVLWLTGIIVSLAVGFGLVGGVLAVPWIPTIVTVTAGWIVVILTVLGVLLKIIDLAK